MVKGKNITILNLKQKLNFSCDYFIICSGESKNQVYAIFQSIKNYIIKKFKTSPWHVEGIKNQEWILIDYTTIVVHIFQDKIRSYYNLENLWKNTDWN